MQQLLLLLLLLSLLSSTLTTTIAITTVVKNITVVKNSKAHYDVCLKYYGSRNYIPFDVDNLIVPPLLTRLPGSGNSWVRLLLEYSTGFWVSSWVIVRDSIAIAQWTSIWHPPNFSLPILRINKGCVCMQ